MTFFGEQNGSGVAVTSPDLKRGQRGIKHLKKPLKGSPTYEMISRGKQLNCVAITSAYLKQYQESVKHLKIITNKMKMKVKLFHSNSIWNQFNYLYKILI